MKYAQEVTVSSTDNSPGVVIEVDGIRAAKLTLDHAANLARMLKALVDGMRHTQSGTYESYTILQQDALPDA